MIALQLSASLLIGYIVGSLPVGYIVVRLLRHKNILEIGDGRPGAANIFREVGKGWGILVGWLDIFKGALAVILVLKGLSFPEFCILPAAVGSLVGHNWSCFSRFKGGHGVGVTMGVYFIFMPAFFFIFLGIYHLFMLLWIRRIRPFYLYHAFNWQSVICVAPVIVYYAGPYLLVEAWGVDHFTIFMLSICMAAAGLLKQVAIYGVMFLFSPSDFDPKSIKWAEKVLDKLRPKG